MAQVARPTFRQLLDSLEQTVKRDASLEDWSAQQVRQQLEAVRTIRSILHRNGLLDKETKR